MPVVDLKGKNVGALGDAAVKAVHLNLSVFEIALVGFFADEVTVHFHTVGVVGRHDHEAGHVNRIGWNHKLLLETNHAVVAVAVGCVPDPMGTWNVGIPSRVRGDFKRPLSGGCHRRRRFVAENFHRFRRHVFVARKWDNIRPGFVFLFFALDTIVGILVGVNRVNVASVVEHDLLDEGPHLDLNGVGPEFLTVLDLSVSPSFVTPISIQTAT